ncbi:MAG: hypothetical protein Q4E02_04230 [Lagierella massiliensis]|nr:hypothetical protein [Lagierella massiliensis]
MIIKTPILKTYNSIEKNLENLIKLINSIDSVDLVLLQQRFFQGTSSFNFRYIHDSNIAIFQNGLEIVKIQEALKNKNFCLGFGYYENFKGGLYNSFIVLHPKYGKLLNYRTNSINWKAENACADYRQGHSFYSFKCKGKEIAPITAEDFLDEENLPKLIEMDCDVDLYYVTSIYNLDFSIKKFLKISEILDKPILLVEINKINSYAKILKHGKIRQLRKFKNKIQI